MCLKLKSLMLYIPEAIEHRAMLEQITLDNPEMIIKVTFAKVLLFTPEQFLLVTMMLWLHPGWTRKDIKHLPFRLIMCT